MTSASDVLALILELLTWVGLVPGVILLAAGYLRLVYSARFEKTWGVVIASPTGSGRPFIRWMDRGRELRTAPIPEGDLDHEGKSLAVGDEVPVYFDRRKPERGRLDNPTGDGRLLRVLGWVLSGIGAGAAVVQLILLFLE